MILHFPFSIRSQNKVPVCCIRHVIVTGLSNFCAFNVLGISDNLGIASKTASLEKNSVTLSRHCAFSSLLPHLFTFQFF